MVIDLDSNLKQQTMTMDDVLAFYQIVRYKDEDDARLLAKSLNFDYDEYKRRIYGKEREYDFIVLLKSLGILKDFVAYDESFSHVTGEYTPDFNVKLINGYRMLLEVKHTKKDQYEISLGNLQKRMDFADRQNLPLIFAVSIKGRWGLFTAEKLKEKGGKLLFCDLIGSDSISCLDSVLDTCSYRFDDQIKTKSVYSVNHPKGMGIKYEPYGQMISYELYSNDKRIFRVKGKNSPQLVDLICLEALQDRAGKIHRDIQQVGDTTVVTEYLDKESNQIIPEYEFLLIPIKHLTKDIDSKTVRYNSILAIKDQLSLINVGALRNIIAEMADKGVNITVFRNYMGYKFEDYVKLFWHKGSRNNEG